MANKIPEILTSFRVYYAGARDMLGVVDTELPDIENMTESIKGAGIAGELDVPVVGHFSAMSMTLNFRTVTGDLTLFGMPVPHILDLRGAIQQHDASLGTRSLVAMRVALTATTKKLKLGKMGVGEAMGSAVELDINRLAVTLDNKPHILIDKLNFIHMINGVDHMAELRTALGL